MKFREDIGMGISAIMGLLDGGCTAFYITLPTALLALMRICYLTLFIICVCVVIRNSINDRRVTNAEIRVKRQCKVREQWLKEYEQFRQEIHGKDSDL